MDTHSDLSEMERFYMALADRTRLRLLNLMRNGEVCVCFFTEVLGESQPKISRHLAYLRGAGMVAARRDGKWMHYRITWPEEDAARGVLQSALEWLAGRDDMQVDLKKYERVCCTPELLVQIARTPIDFIAIAEPYQPAQAAERPAPERVDSRGSRASSHNELEEFLL